jgi:hypothetical protein
MLQPLFSPGSPQCESEEKQERQKPGCVGKTAAHGYQRQPRILSPSFTFPEYPSTFTKQQNTVSLSSRLSETAPASDITASEIRTDERTRQPFTFFE